MIINENLDYEVSEICIDETEEAQFESQNSETKTISDHMKQVSKKANIKTSLYLI